LLLEAQPSLAAGRSWSLAKAMQLIRNDARPHRWVALQQNKHAWGLFWAGGGLQLCRELLADQVSEAEACTALVPATPEALLKLLLELDQPAKGTATHSTRATSGAWKLVALTSVGWLVVLGITVVGFMGALERQDKKLDALINRLLVKEGPTVLPRGAPAGWGRTRYKQQ